MKKDSFKGILCLPVTPFTKKDEVDEEAYRKLIRFVIDDLGITGIVPAGSTGEFSSLFWEEQKKIIKIAVDEANGKVDVMAGTGTSGTKRTIEMTKYAKDVGADAGQRHDCALWRTASPG